MSDVKGLRVVVAGAGAIGSVCALILARRGAKVVLSDPAARGDNASGVAAGMLAPVCEALFDGTSQGHLPLLRTALQAWDRLLPDMAASLDRSGAVIEAGDAQAVLRRAEAIGALVEPMAADQARRLCPGLGPPGPFLFTAEDWRLDARTMLAALHQALRAEGGQLLRSPVTGRPAPGADILVQATGPGPDLTPIKGQRRGTAGSGP